MRAFAVHAQLGEEVGILGHQDRRALAVGTALAIGSGEIAVARGDQEIVAVRHVEEDELSGARGAQLDLLEVDVVGSGDGDQADDSAGECVAGGEFLHGALHHAGGDGWENKEGNEHGGRPRHAKQNRARGRRRGQAVRLRSNFSYG